MFPEEWRRTGIREAGSSGETLWAVGWGSSSLQGRPEDKLRRQRHVQGLEKWG